MESSDFIEIWIAGRPIPKMRQRTLKTGHSYDPQHLLKRRIRDVIWHEWRTQYHGIIANGKPVIVTYEFDFRPPASWSMKKQLEAIELRYHTIKPDVSNLVKFYEDVMNGIVFHDDSQIIEVVAEKQYAAQDGTKIQIRTI